MAKLITPEQLAASGNESGHQKALFCWAAIMRPTYPELRYMYASPNGKWRNKIDAANLKAEGVKKGVPDVSLLVRRHNYSGLFIELKRPESVGKTQGITSDEQIDFMIFLQAQGFLCIISIGWERARDAIIEYLMHNIVDYNRFKHLIPDKLK